MRKEHAALLAGAAVAAAALIGAQASLDADGPSRRWYDSLDKPPFTPPSPVFGAAWATLDVLLGIAGYRLMTARPSPGRPTFARNTALGLWGALLGGIAAWPHLVFTRHRLDAGFALTATMFGWAAAAVGLARRADPAAAAMMTPLAGWLAFATALAEEIWRRNPAQPEPGKIA